jgi:hypothetical protein
MPQERLSRVFTQLYSPLLPVETRLAAPRAACKRRQRNGKNMHNSGNAMATALVRVLASLVHGL